MKAHCFIKALVLLVIAILSFCKNPMEQSRKATLIISISSLQAKTIQPAISLEPAVFDISGSGPNGSAFSASTEYDTVEITGLEIGTWEVTVLAENIDGIIIGQGIETATVQYNETKTLNIIISPLDGYGTLDLQVYWTAEEVSSPAIEAKLMPSSGDPINLSFVINNGNTASCTNNTIPTGYYTLDLQLFDAGTLAIGAVEVVRIMKDQVTAGTFKFYDLILKGNIQVNIIPELKEAIDIILHGQLNEISAGATMNLAASAADEESGILFIWYLNGESKSTGSGTMVGSDLPVGVYRLDVTAFNSDATRGGSATHIFRVLDSVLWGSLTYSTGFKDGENGITMLGNPRGVTVSADGKNVYAAAYDDNSLLVFNRDSITGSLTFSQYFKDGDGGVDCLSGARSVVVSSDGKSVYVTGYVDNGLAVFNRDTGTGALTFTQCFYDDVGGIDCLYGAKGITISPDGKNVYVTGYQDNGLAVFNRDTGTGNLTYSGYLKEGENGVAGLDGPEDITVSPDGKNVYVTGFTGDTLAVFNRDTTTGELSYSSLFRDEQGGVDGLNGASGITVSPDGDNVFATGYYDNALAVFNRDPVTGALSFYTFFKKGIDNVDGLYHAREAAVSLDGKNVYVTGGGDDAIVVFNRDTTTGVITFSSYHKDNVEGVDGLDSAIGVAVSPDGKNVYVTGSVDNALAVFNRFIE